MVEQPRWSRLPTNKTFDGCLISCEISLFFTVANREGLHEFGVARSEELEVNHWIVQDMHWLSSQSERAKNTIHRFSIY